MNSPAKNYKVVALIYFGLIAATWIVFAHAYSFEFISIDDDQFITENPYVQNPFTPDSLYWALTMRNRNTWHPLTWLSHMLDYYLFGLNAGAHHLMSVFIHTISTLLLFEALRRMGRTRDGTEPLWRSTFVALLFAVHPLHIQPVAWVALRKDVLSTCIEFGALLAYVVYTARPSIVRFLPVLALYALALTAKSMVLPLPALLLLLDYWPLQRYTGAMNRTLPGYGAVGRDSKGLQPLVRRPRYSWGVLVLEKVPFFVLAAAFTLFIMENKTPQIVSLGYRLANVPVAYATYLRQTFWPTGLAMFYLHPGDTLPLWKSAVSTVFLAFLTLAAVALYRRKPYVFVGWFWYVGMLLPVCGIMQISTQGSADHYTYVPLIGIFIVVVWAVSDLRSKFANQNPKMAKTLLLGSGAALIAVTAAGYHQANYWKNGLTLFTQAAKVSSNSGRMHVSVANELFAAGDIEKAAYHFQEAIRIEANDPVEDAYNNLGLALAVLGRNREAIDYYKRAIEIAPDYVDAYINLATAFTQEKRFDEAIAILRSGITKSPGVNDLRDLLGRTLLASAAQLIENGDRENAVAQYQEALQIDPNYAPAWNNFGAIFNDLGQTEKAFDCYTKALQLEPRYAKAHANLAQLLAVRGDLDGAAQHYQNALEADPTYANALLGLVKTFVRLQRPQDALACFRKWPGIFQAHPADFAQLGAFLEQTNDVQTAIALYENLLSTDSKDPSDNLSLRMNLARAYAAQNRLPDAVAQYQEVIKADPANADAYFNLAALTEVLGNTDEARQYLIKTLDINPEDQAARDRLERLGGNGL